jgi:alpha-galactosidase
MRRATCWQCEGMVCEKKRVFRYCVLWWDPTSTPERQVDYSAPGSEGQEIQDVNWMVAAGATALKIDSCCGSQDHATAFKQYGLWNATGKPVLFSVCGWETWYAPPDPSVNYTGGYGLGNQWRIAGDGDTWPALTNCFNTAAKLRQYAGPGGWNDPARTCSSAPTQSRTAPSRPTSRRAPRRISGPSSLKAPLIISNNLIEASQYNIASYRNEEVIAVNQDPLGVPGYRIVGGDLTYPSAGGGGLPENALYGVQALACEAANPMQKWVLNNGSTIQLASTSGGVAVLDAYACGTQDETLVYAYPPDNGSVTCGGKNQQWTMSLSSGGTITNGFSGKCLDVFEFAGPAVDVYTCNGGQNQAFTLTAAGQLQTASGPNGPSLCLEAVPANTTNDACSNVCGRPLHDGSWA